MTQIDKITKFLDGLSELEKKRFVTCPFCGKEHEDVIVAGAMHVIGCPLMSENQEYRLAKTSEPYSKIPKEIPLSKIIEAMREMQKALEYVSHRDWNWEKIDNQWKWLNEFRDASRGALTRVAEILK